MAEFRFGLFAFVSVGYFCKKIGITINNDLKMAYLARVMTHMAKACYFYWSFTILLLLKTLILLMLFNRDMWDFLIKKSIDPEQNSSL